MQFSYGIEGLDKLARNMGVVQADLEKEINKGLFACAQKVEAEAKKSIQGGKKTGHVYTHYFLTNKKTRQIFEAAKRNKPHQASAPGEAPASDTGRLANSISSYLNAGKNESFVTAGRGTALYAALLEFGTRKIKPRPFMFPALERSRDFIKNRLTEAMQRAINKK